MDYSACSQKTASAHSSDLIETLHTVIAPGRRSRISPFIEAAQFQVLFNQRPESKRRYEHARMILHAHTQDIRKLAQTWVNFLHAGKRFSAHIYSEEFLRAYLAYYLTTNVCKLQLVLLELVKQGKLTGSLTLVTSGSEPERQR